MPACMTTGTNLGESDAARLSRAALRIDGTGYAPAGTVGRWVSAS